MTTLHSRNGNCVAALQPALGDLFVVTLLGGKVVSVRPTDEYEQALGLAQAFADEAAGPDGRPYTVKVHGMSLAELLAFKGISRDDFAAGLAQQGAELRTIAERTCKEVLLSSNDAAVRRDAFDLLSSMGVMRDDH